MLEATARPTVRRDWAQLAVARLQEELGKLFGAALAPSEVRALEKSANVLCNARLRRERAAKSCADQSTASTDNIGKKRMRSLRGEMLEADPRCAYCERPLTERSATLDHVIPESRGGQNVRSNLVLACTACNVSKGDRTACEWADAIVAVASASQLEQAAT